MSTAQRGRAVNKVFNEMSNVGSTKYVVNYHDGIDTHKDGSPFYGAALFSNKRVKDRFVKKLLAEGYAAR